MRIDEDSEFTEMRIVMRVILTVKYGENSYIQRLEGSNDEIFTAVAIQVVRNYIHVYNYSMTMMNNFM